MYVWERDDWPSWRWSDATLAAPLADVSRRQGLLLGRLADLGPAARERASLAVPTEDVVDSAAIEGERLDPASVRSSIALRLGIDIGALAPADRRTAEAMVPGRSGPASDQPPSAPHTGRSSAASPGSARVYVATVVPGPPGATWRVSTRKPSSWVYAS